MSSKTKIVVLRMKEIIYTAIFIGFGILLVMLLFIMFHPKKENSSDSASTASYIPGVYASSLTLGSHGSFKRFRRNHVSSGSALSGASDRPDLQLPVSGKPVLSGRNPLYFPGFNQSH